MGGRPGTTPGQVSVCLSEAEEEFPSFLCLTHTWVLKFPFLSAFLARVSSMGGQARPGRIWQKQG